jgi:hypothetical protein
MIARLKRLFTRHLTERRFLKLLRQTPRVWSLSTCAVGKIRCHLGTQFHCPVSAVAEHNLGVMGASAGNPWSVARDIRLKDVDRIVAAADNRKIRQTEPDPKLRKRLLRACGLPEER